MKFLYVAYAATWLIHIGYLGTLVSRYVRLRREIEDVHRRSS
jgi:CcmD family protein